MILFLIVLFKFKNKKGFEILKAFKNYLMLITQFP
jgi:hypothetical protein